MSLLCATFLRNLRLPSKRFYSDAETQISLVFAAGNTTFYANEPVKQVDVSSLDGSFGILPKHIPTLSVLMPGIVSVFEIQGGVKKIFASSGTVSVHDDSSVQILAEEACELDDIDLGVAKELLAKARHDVEVAPNAVEKAKAAMRVVVGEAIVRAAETGM